MGVYDSVNWKHLYVWSSTKSCRLFQTEEMILIHDFCSFCLKALMEILIAYWAQRLPIKYKYIVSCIGNAWSFAFALVKIRMRIGALAGEATRFIFIVPFYPTSLLKENWPCAYTQSYRNLSDPHCIIFDSWKRKSKGLEDIVLMRWLI